MMFSILPDAYAQTIASLQSAKPALTAAQPPPPPDPPPPPPSPPLHPLVQLLTSRQPSPRHAASSSAGAFQPAAASQTVAASAPSLLSSSPPSALPRPPSPSEYLGESSALHPNSFFCRTCLVPLSDCFHLSEGDDRTATVSALYEAAVDVEEEMETDAACGAFYRLLCRRCQSPLGRYYRFTAPSQQNKSNCFTLDLAAVGFRKLGSGSVRGEEYATETGIAARLTQLMLGYEALREDMRGMQDRLRLLDAKLASSSSQAADGSDAGDGQQDGSAKRRRESAAVSASDKRRRESAAVSSSASSSASAQQADDGEHSGDDKEAAEEQRAAGRQKAAAAAQPSKQGKARSRSRVRKGGKGW